MLSFPTGLLTPLCVDLLVSYVCARTVALAFLPVNTLFN